MSKDKKAKGSKSSKRKEAKRSSKSAASPEASSNTYHAHAASMPALASSEHGSAFETMYPVLNLPIPPVWTNDPYSAFSDLMDTLVMRYVPQLSGVLITHSPTRFLQDTAVFSADSAFATASVGFECVVWRPKIGQVLEGTVCLSSPSHVSLLLYGLFNASIPASHLPEDEWEFVVNDGQPTSATADQGLGHWCKRSDGSKLGGSSGKVTFTVVSLTIANHMLSLHGSLLKDPFQGPAPTFDRSYLKKSLLPNQALGLGSMSTPRTEQAANNSRSPAPRKVRWQDEDDSSSSDNDGRAGLSSHPPSLAQSAVVEERDSSSKRKSSSDTKNSSDLDSPSKREKKRRKEA
ncbi:hypothetical protein BCV70DRAFT_16259 [Testicularia cyperi]|uniref:RPA43 OB domain-containing protein n=1 Tax=Testicularia cyperi TaxID=1882483 RepID=A0A317XYM4_9BASI|nr:hypothetical protein BCV70DRAFT_16259 [Testicularia cyperi]